MSTEALAEPIPKPTPAARWRSDLRTVRVFRYGVGVTLAMAISFAFEWPLFFLTPILVAFLLALPLPAPTLDQVGYNALYLLAAFALGLLFTLFLLPYPLVYVVSLGLLLFRIYYLANRGGPLMLVLMSLLAILILPMMAVTDESLAVGFAGYFAASGALAMCLQLLAYRLFPDPPGGPAMPRRPPPARYSKPAALAALKSTTAILPIATLFIAASWQGEMLVMVFAAMFSLSPEVAKGTAAGRKSLVSTLIGGAAALVFYALIVAVPEFHFFVALTLGVALAFGAAIFSTRPIAQYLPSAMIAVIVLIGGSLGEDADIGAKLALRVFLLVLATLYVIGVLKLLERWFPSPA